MRAIAVVTLLLALTACGVDGEPEPPARSGLSISGTASIGIVGGN